MNAAYECGKMPPRWEPQLANTTISESWEADRPVQKPQEAGIVDRATKWRIGDSNP